MRPLLLDLFCGAGGGAWGYDLAGYEVIGVDSEPQPDYPFEFHQADALDVLRGGYERLVDGIATGRDFAAIHASPPCQDHSSLTPAAHGTGWMLDATVALLADSGVPWVCENVVGPNVRMSGWWFVLCGSMFGLQVQRHRRFGSSELMMPPACHHKWQQGRPYTITGHGGSDVSPHSLKPKASDFWRYLDMPWMEGRPSYGVTQAIPPAYTQWIGEQLLAHNPGGEGKWTRP